MSVCPQLVDLTLEIQLSYCLLTVPIVILAVLLHSPFTRFTLSSHSQSSLPSALRLSHSLSPPHVSDSLPLPPSLPHPPPPPSPHSTSVQVAVASVRDTGRDLDHCHVLIKKLEDFENDLSVDKGHVDQVLMFAQKLIGGRHSMAAEVGHLVAELNER